MRENQLFPALMPFNSQFSIAISWADERFRTVRPCDLARIDVRAPIVS